MSLSIAFKDYRWLWPTAQADPAPNVGDIVYRYSLAALAYGAGLALALVLALTPAAAESGLASIYDEPQALACGGRLNVKALAAAHKTLPCGTRVEVTAGNRRVVVTINDRGPYVRGRIIDLTPASAARLGFTDGLKPVTIKVHNGV